MSGRAGEDFPTTVGAFDRTFNGGTGEGPHSQIDAFVLKLSTDGKLIYSTYIRDLSISSRRPSAAKISKLARPFRCRNS